MIVRHLSEVPFAEQSCWKERPQTGLLKFFLPVLGRASREGDPEKHSISGARQGLEPLRPQQVPPLLLVAAPRPRDACRVGHHLNSEAPPRSTERIHEEPFSACPACGRRKNVKAVWTSADPKSWPDRADSFGRKESELQRGGGR